MVSEPSDAHAPTRQLLPHSTPPWVRADAIFFVTICCGEHGVNQLCTSKMADALFEVARFRVTRGDWFVHLLVLMPHHLHALISFRQDREMKKVISNWKEITAKRTGVRWQRDFFDHRLRAEESYEEKARYIRMNPVRKKLAVHPAEWSFQWEPNHGGPSGPALPRP